MDTVGELFQDDKDFLAPWLPHDPESPERPFVTLTYAMSLDGMISLAPGTRTVLSGPKTKSMTHYLRLHHDCILVGVGTAIADDPSLTCRYPSVTPHSQPRPVIVDPSLRWEVDKSRVETLAREGRGKSPWIITASHEHSDDQRLLVNDDGLVSSKMDEEEVQHGAPPRIKWAPVLKALKQKGIQSVMIEGGATVINELLSQSDLIDSVIITIAPTWLGQGGVTVSPASKTEDGRKVNAANLQYTSWRQFGDDAVVAGRLLK